MQTHRGDRFYSGSPLGAVSPIRLVHLQPSQPSTTTKLYRNTQLTRKHCTPTDSGSRIARIVPILSTAEWQREQTALPNIALYSADGGNVLEFELVNAIEKLSPPSGLNVPSGHYTQFTSAWLTGDLLYPTFEHIRSNF